VLQERSRTKGRNDFSHFEKNVIFFFNLLAFTFSLLESCNRGKQLEPESGAGRLKKP
jgi:hypothetical protein